MSNELPQRPYSGMSISEVLSSSWLGKLFDFVRANKVSGDGKTIKVNRTLGGTTISAIRGPGGGGGGSSEVIPYLYKINNQSRYTGANNTNWKCLVGFEGGVVNIQSINLTLPIYKNNPENEQTPEEKASIEITSEGVYKAYLVYNYNFTDEESTCELEISDVDENIISHRHLFIGSFIAETIDTKLKITQTKLDASDCKIKRVASTIRIGGVTKNSEATELDVDESSMDVYAKITLSVADFTIDEVSINENVPEMSGSVTNASLGHIYSAESGGKRRITSLTSSNVNWASSLWS